jgi:hypothetical protein
MVALAACATTRIGSFVETGGDVDRYRTYSWAQAEPRSVGDPRLDSNPFFLERVRSSVEKQLRAKGFETMTTERPDLFVRFHASVNQAINLNNANEEDGPCDPGECEPYVYEAGSLVIDLLDSRTDKLFWRGWINGVVGDAIDDQGRMEQRIDEAVARIFARFPAKS